MSGIKVRDLAWGRFAAPDLDRAEQFLTDFGLTRLERSADRLYMRGADGGPFLHVTEQGDPRFLGAAFLLDSADDLARAARLPGASAIEPLDGPCDGQRVRVTEPNGYVIELVHGMTPLAPMAVPRDPTNSGAEPLRRAGRMMRLSRSPTPIRRSGHLVLTTPRVAETVAWFRTNLGLLRSDDLLDGSPDRIVGSFNRLDRGEEFVDHHVLFCAYGERAGLNHLSFEVSDIDAVFQDHEYLKGLGRYEHMWGIGRHKLGSQVYDYWCDPWGRVHERWADSDRLNAANGGNLVDVTRENVASQWGDPFPPRFRGWASP
ncbi:MAG: catechol 1,2-dioxygenase [Alphaproteobacteria bacterium]|nr:catechol 1,2-dioxygenase [Alphaproteobacteria bacterium]